MTCSRRPYGAFGVAERVASIQGGERLTDPRRVDAGAEPDAKTLAQISTEREDSALPHRTEDKESSMRRLVFSAVATAAALIAFAAPASAGPTDGCVTPPAVGPFEAVQVCIL
jgi:hypothetical protein